METVVLVLFFLAGGRWDTEALISVRGMVGEDVSVTCTHANAFSNIKYFCKGQCNYEDILISSGEKKDSNRKYSITDNGNTFHVNISHVTKEDAGTYWCGIERTGLDTYNEVVLTVTEGKIYNPENYEKLMYVKAGLGVVVFSLVIMILVMFLRHRKRHIGASSGKNLNATLSSQKEDNIYSNVKGLSEAQLQSDTLLYTTVSFNKHAECSPVTSETGAVTYSTTAHKSTDESTLYSNVELSADH